MPGRSSQRTQENAVIILAEIEAGATRINACRIVGISTDTLNRWEKADAAFALRLEKAEGVRNRGLVRDMRRYGRRDWRMYAWLLERVAKDEYGTPKVDVNLTVTQIREKAEKVAAILGVPTEEVIEAAGEVAAEAWSSWKP